MAPATNDILLGDQIVQTDHLLFPALRAAISLITGGRIVLVRHTHYGSLLTPSVPALQMRPLAFFKHIVTNRG